MPRWRVAGRRCSEYSETQRVRVDPLAKWKQIYRELWRIERSYFYDANLHCLDAVAMGKKYEPYVETLASRDN